MSLPHNYEMVIGLEVHAQVTTQSKLFSGSATAFGAEPNTQANQIDLGMPGMLPVVNAGAIDAGIKLGLAINAKVNTTSVFARKNYYYPDLPKGYQISQFDKPIVEHGQLEIDMPEGPRTIGITRMHLEEDAGKSIHDMGSGNVSYVDLNRAGVPLMEIVSEPDLRTPEEAGAYMKKIRTLLRFLEVCDGDMEKGNLRCDANVSVRKIGETKLNTRCEIKNLNSIRHVMAAIQHEAERHVQVWESGGEVAQETRLWDPELNETRTLRTKEDAHDYRYFPDPDLLPVKLNPARIEKIRATLPELPDALKNRLMKDYNLSAYDAALLTSEKSYADYYLEMLKVLEGLPANPLIISPGPRELNAKIAANWMTVELFSVLNKMNLDLENSPISAQRLGELVVFIVGGGRINDAPMRISGNIAKMAFAQMLENPDKSAAEVIAAIGLFEISDEAILKPICAAAIAANPDAVAKFKAGNERIFGSFVGFVMKETKGQANPELVNKLLREAIDAA